MAGNRRAPSGKHGQVLRAVAGIDSVVREAPRRETPHRTSSETRRYCAMRENHSSTAGRRRAAGWIGAGALLLGLTGCQTNDAQLPFTPGVDARTNLDQSAGRTAEILDTEIREVRPPDDLEPVVDPARPWTELTAIWFYYRRADLMGTETERIAEIVRYTRQHPGAEVGINRPADISGVEPENDDVNRQRVATIREALICGGIPAVQIHAGAFEGQPASINRLVLVFVRDAR